MYGDNTDMQNFVGHYGGRQILEIGHTKCQES